MTISLDDIGKLAVYAVHDVMGRESFVPDVIRPIVLRQLPELLDRDVRALREHCRWQKAAGAYGHQKGEWVKFAARVEEECERRGI